MQAPPVEFHCPYGCAKGRTDELGYCRHLIGFTNDCKVLEPIHHELDANGKRTGVVRVVHKKRQLVRKTDRLVNPESQQLDEGVWHKVKKWVSARVYSSILPRPPMTEEEIELLKEFDPPDPLDPEFTDEELEALTQPEGVV